jgi:hypothetical protein
MDMDKMKEKPTQIDPLATIPALQREREHEWGEKRESSNIVLHEVFLESEQWRGMNHC